MWEMWWQMCHLRLLCPTLHARENLWWMQLRKFPRQMCHLWRSWSQWCLLLQRVYDSREGQRRLSKDCQLRIQQNRFVLWKEEVRIQTTLIARPVKISIPIKIFSFFTQTTMHRISFCFPKLGWFLFHGIFSTETLFSNSLIRLHPSWRDERCNRQIHPFVWFLRRWHKSSLCPTCVRWSHRHQPSWFGLKHDPWRGWFCYLPS